jgi:hypothetical protein
MWMKAVYTQGDSRKRRYVYGFKSICYGESGFCLLMAGFGRVQFSGAEKCKVRRHGVDTLR